jgi:translocation and assembly module TamB
LIIFGALALSAVFALALLPWWLGPLLKVTLPGKGLTFAAYEKFGYGRFVLRDVKYKIENVRVTADRFEADTPLLWAWRHRAGNSRDIKVTHWQVDVLAPEKPAGGSVQAKTDGGALLLRGQLRSIAEFLERWLPHVTAETGQVKWPEGQLEIAGATWKNRELRVRGLVYGPNSIDAAAEFLANDVITLDAASPGNYWQAKLQSRGKTIEGILSVWQQQATIFAAFDDQGWMPATLVARAENLAIPGGRIGLGEFYSTVRGAVSLNWSKGIVETTIDLNGEALAGKQAPPLNVKLHGHGDTRAFTVETLVVDAPGVSAKLNAPVELGREGARVSNTSVFHLAIDLAKQPWVSAEGILAGEAKIIMRRSGWPTIETSLKGSGVKFQEWGGAAEAEATLEWPRLEVKSATLMTNHGDHLKFSGEWNFQSKELSGAELDAVVSGTAVAQWLPSEMRFTTATLAIKGHGTIAALEHSGALDISGLTAHGLKPTQATATWRGKGTAVEITEVKALAGGSSLVATGTFDINGAVAHSIRFSQGGVERLTLSQPAAVRWRPALKIESIHLAGDGGSIEVAVTTGGRGRLALSMQNVSSVLGRDFLEIPGPDWRVSSLALTGQWDNGPATFTMGGELEFTLSPDRRETVTIGGRGDAAGLSIEKLQLVERDSPILSATAKIPLILYPGQPSAWMQFDENASLELRVDSVANPHFWEQLAATTGIDFRQPEITAQLSGTWRSPKGELRLKAARLAVSIPRFPAIEELDLNLQINREGFAIDRLEAKFDGQAIRANGVLPLTPAHWAEFRKEPFTFLRNELDLNIEVPDAEVAALAHFFPDAIAPTGRLQLSASLRKGGKMEGVVRLHGAASRPIGSLGIVQNIEAEVRLDGDTVEIHSLTAQAGGQPVKLSGTVRLPRESAVQYNLELKGENLPLLRQTALLLRGDVDLKLTNPDGPPTVSGTVKLRESIFLSDVRAIIPRERTNVPSLRPPFFSVETVPFNKWQLNVALDGERFLRLRSTVFVGLASAHFKLLGTLGEPRAIGEAVVNNGQVLLPFATITLDQGSVRLTEADPHTLGLFISGTARRYDYDLRMEITGTAAQPVVTFTSSPPLQPSQVLLLVMAGEAPHNEIVYNTAQRMSLLGAYLGQSLISSVGGDSSQAERMSISSGERISQQGRETYEIEYRLNDRFSLVGEYDEFDAYNAGVKWRLIAPEKTAEKISAQSASGSEAPKP